jgi:hypothetical protein
MTGRASEAKPSASALNACEKPTTQIAESDGRASSWSRRVRRRGQRWPDGI